MSETAQQAARSLQGYRIELAPTPEQRTRLAQHAGLARVAENFYLEKVRAALAQRAAEQTYGVAEADLTRVPWTAPQLEALWRAAHPDRYPWFIAEGLSSRVPKEAARCRASALKNWVASRAGKRKGPKVGFPSLAQAPRRGPVSLRRRPGQTRRRPHRQTSRHRCGRHPRGHELADRADRGRSRAGARRHRQGTGGPVVDLLPARH